MTFRSLATLSTFPFLFLQIWRFNFSIKSFHEKIRNEVVTRVCVCLWEGDNTLCAKEEQERVEGKKYCYFKMERKSDLKR